MELHLRVLGFLFIILALMHAGFPRYFRWKEDLNPLSLINRQMMHTHAFFIAFVVLLMGLLCISSPAELTETALGRRISLGLGVFWATRLLFQFFGYSSLIWKGKTFETTVHVVFSFLWIYATMVFLFVFFR